MSSFNAGKIEADLTLGRSQWVKDLRTTKKEIADLEKTGITIGIDADDTNARVVMDNLELMLDDLGRSRYTPEIDVETREANRVIERLDDRLDALNRKAVEVEVFADTTNAEIVVDNFERSLESLDDEGVNIRVKVLSADAHAELDRLQAKIDKMSADEVSIGADADITNAMIQLDILENQMDVLENDGVDVQVDVDSAAAEEKLIELAAFVNNLDNQDFDIQIDVDGYEAANARLLTLAAQVELLDGRDIDIDIDVDRGMLDSLVGGASGGGGGGGSLGLLRILMYAILILSPLLAVATSSLTATIIAFASAVTAAAGAALILGAGLFGLVQRFKDTDPSQYTPEMQAFADSIDAVSDAWGTFLDGIEGPGFTLMAQALEIVAGILPDLVPLFNNVADAMSGVLDGLAKWIDSPQYQEMLDFFGGFGVDMLVSFLDIGGNLLVFFGELFAAIEPFARTMMTGLEDLTAGWAEWAAGLEDNDAFQQFMDNAAKYGPMILDMLGSMVQAFMNLGQALEPFAGPMLEALTWFFDLIANFDTDQLTILIGIFAGMWAGANVVLPLLGAIGGALTAISTAAGIGLGPLALIAGGIALVVTAIMDLWDNNEKFRQSVMDTWQSIQDTVLPIVEDVWATIQENWGPIKEWAVDIFETVKNTVVDAMTIIQFIVGQVTEVVDVIWTNWGDDILNTVVTIFGGLGTFISGVFTVIQGIFAFITGVLTGDWDKTWQGLEDIASGGLDIIIGLFTAFVAPLRLAWQVIKDVAVKVWENTMEALQNKWTSFRGWIDEKWTNFKTWIQGWAPNFPEIWEDIKTKWASMRANIEEKWTNFKTWVSGFAPNFPEIWDGIQTKWTEMRTWIDGKWTNFKTDVAAWAIGAVNIFDPIKESFRGVLNAIVNWWNGFSLSVDIPDKIPGLPDSFTISTPDVGGYAKGAYVPGNQPHLKWFGEGPDNEVVAPEPILRQIVEEHSGSKIDYGKMAEAVASALGSVLATIKGVTKEDLEYLLQYAGVNINFDLDDRRGPNDVLTDSDVRRLMFELRRMGFGGFGNV